jgi:RimJ/RimL family protein N-acetyltransferase
LATASLVADRLISDRLVLDALAVRDADEMLSVLEDPELYAYTGGAPPDLTSLRERYARQVRGRSPDGSALWLNWIIRTRGSGDAVGYVQVTFRIDGGVADLAWVIGTEHQRRGYATEAARAVVSWLDTHQCVERVTAHIAPANRASEAVAGRLGFIPIDEIERGEMVWERHPAGHRKTPQQARQ